MEHAKYAGFRIRFLAMLIDVVIMLIVFSLPAAYIYGQAYWEGDQLSVGKAIGRYFAHIPATIPLFLGFFWIVFNDRKQGWHDLLAGTVVVRSETKGPFEFNSQDNIAHK